MKFTTKAEAQYYKRRHTAEFQKRLRVVRCRWQTIDVPEGEPWTWHEGWTVVMVRNAVEQ